CLFDLNLLQARISKNGGDGGAFGQPVAMKTDNRIANADAAADDPAKCDPAEIVAIVEIRNEHLEKRLGGNLRRRHRFNYGLKQRRRVCARVRQVAPGKTFFGARVNHRKIKLLIRALHLEERAELEIQHYVRTSV